MSRLLTALPLAFVLTYGAAYVIDYACDGCLQENRPACREYRSNPIEWWKCSQRAAHSAEVVKTTDS